MEDSTELEVFEKEKLEEIEKEEEQYAITVLEEKKAQMKPNMAAIAEYKKKVIFFVDFLDYMLFYTLERKLIGLGLRKQVCYLRKRRI